MSKQEDSKAGDASATKRPAAFKWKLSAASRRVAESTPKAVIKEPWEAAVLHLLAEQEAIPGDQLARFLRCDLGTAKRIADHLENSGLVQTAVGPAKTAPWIWVTADGARLSGGEFDYAVPRETRARDLRLANEARLFARQMFPAGQWLSARVLESSGSMPVPTGVVRSGDREYAIEIEAHRAGASPLVRKYERLRAQHRSDGREVVVLCASANLAPLEALARDRGWTDFLIRQCPVFDGEKPAEPPIAGGSNGEAARSKGKRRAKPVPIDMPLVQIAVAELPQPALKEIARAEGSRSLPSISLVGRRIGGGPQRWRVTTTKQVWRVTTWRGRWRVSPASAVERRQKLLPPELKWRRTQARSGQLPLLEVDVANLPAEALEAIQAAEGSAVLPEALVAGRCLGCGAFLRFRVTTESGVWRVSRTAQGWRAWRANAEETAQQFFVPDLEPDQDARHDPLRDVAEFWKDAPNQLTLIEIDPKELPQGALAAIRSAEKGASPPKVLRVGKRPGHGFPRYRVATGRGVWRVGGNQRGWHVRPAEDWERALRLLPPALPSSPARFQHALAEIAIDDLPEEALQAIQDAEGLSSPPAVKQVAKRKGSGFPRYRVTTERGVWRVSRNQLGWRVRPADAKERAQELFRESSRPDALAERDPDDLPDEALQAIQDAEGLSSPPAVRFVAKRRGRGFARFRVITDTDVWLTAFNPRGWRARPADAEERAEEVVTNSPAAGPVRSDGRTVRPLPLEWVAVEDLSGEVLRQVQAAEGSSSLPKVKLVAKRKGGGSGERWRVTTDREVWRVARSPLGWHIRVSEGPERTQELAVRRPERPPKPCDRPLIEIDVADLPPEAVRAVQEAEHSATPPKVILVGKRKGRGFARYRVTTRANVWRVTANPRGWYAWAASEQERGLQLLPKRRVWPLIEIDVADLPPEAVRAVQEAEHSATPPNVKLVAKSKAPGFPRYRVTTQREVWRVTSSGRRWHVCPADDDERAAEVLRPERLPANLRQRRPRRGERCGTAGDAVEKGGSNGQVEI